MDYHIVIRRLAFTISVVSVLISSGCTSTITNPNYANNPEPLYPNVFIELP